MKNARVIFYLLLAGLFFAGLYTGLRIFFILFLSGVFLILGVLMLNVYTFYTFKYKQVLTQETCESGDLPELHLSLFNENFFPLSILVIHINVVSLTHPVDLTFSLPPFSSKHFEIPVELPYCGTYRVGMSTMRIFDVFDLMPIQFDMHALPYYRMIELVVLPKAYAIDAIPGEVTDAKTFTEANPHLSEQGDSFSDTRLYRRGDAIKRIHWKKSAQHHTLYVKQYDLPEMEAVTLIIDTSVLSTSPLDFRMHVHTLCECAATIALRALRRRKAVRLIFSDDADNELRCEQINQFDRLRRALAMNPFSDRPNNFLQVIENSLPGFSLNQEIYLLTGQTSADFLSAIQNDTRRMRNLVLVQIGGQPTQGLVPSVHVPKGGDVVAGLMAGVH